LTEQRHHTGATQATGKPKVRIITIVWGQRYLDELLDITLPAVLAPGNLPYLAARFDCEFVLVTEEHFFRYIQRQSVFATIAAHCPVRLIHLDDLVVSRQMYGHSLTHALHRGFEDLGDAVIDTYLVFFNSDFVIADGSFRALAAAIESGERLIFAPSYCVFEEGASQTLKDRVDPASGILSMPPREMAALALRHRHYTVRGKTINQPNYHMNISDQFYYLVDEHTLLGRQMPIAIVCMRPEVAYHDPVSFWDYATLTMACPTAKRHVLGDSDDFLMIELRGAKTYSESLRLGQSTPTEMAKVLGGYMTADQFEMGHYDLTLHARDLPPDTAEGRQTLNAYMEQIYAHLPEHPISHIDHPYWANLIEQFHTYRLQWQQMRLMSNSSSHSQGQGQTQPGRMVPTVPVPVMKQRLGRLHQLFARFFGSLPWAGPLHPYQGHLLHARRILEQSLADGSCRSLIVRDNNSYLCRMVEIHTGGHVSVSPGHITSGNAIATDRPYDLCLIELPYSDLAYAPRLYAAIRPHMRQGGKIVIFFDGPEAAQVAVDNAGIILPLLPDSDKCRVYYSGGRALAKAIRLHRAGLYAQRNLPHRLRQLAYIAMLLANSWLARLGNDVAATSDPFAVPTPCTGFTVEIDCTSPGIDA
jgi:hypothetical protein